MGKKFVAPTEKEDQIAKTKVRKRELSGRGISGPRSETPFSVLCLSTQQTPNSSKLLSAKFKFIPAENLVYKHYVTGQKFHYFLPNKFLRY